MIYLFIGNGNNMGAISRTENDINEIVDDLSDYTVVNANAGIDLSKLEILKIKSKEIQKELEKQENQLVNMVVSKKEKSFVFGILGSGQCGSKIAQEFYKQGYPTVAINTAIQDLKYIDIPDSNKLLISYGPGGSARSLEVGREAAVQNLNSIREIINEKLSESQINIFCLGLGGGSGAGSCDVVIDLLAEIGKPVIVIAALPMVSEDAQVKSNALETLSNLAKFTQSKKVNNLIIVDNAKIESLFSNLNQMDFYDVANKVIVEPLDVFNTYSSMPSSTKALDPLEFVKLLTDGDGLSVYGELKVDNYVEDVAIAEAVINNLNSNLLSSGFDLKQSKYVGVIMAANKEVWSKIQASSVNYAIAMINDQCGASQIFKGIYCIDTDEPVLKVYSMFTGLGLPSSRVDQLKKDSQELLKNIKTKEEGRNLNLQLDTGKEINVSAAQKIKDQIAAKSSTFGKFINKSVVDRRK